jgi:hypothetical protein
MPSRAAIKNKIQQINFFSNKFSEKQDHTIKSSLFYLKNRTINRQKTAPLFGSSSTGRHNPGIKEVFAPFPDFFSKETVHAPFPTSL